MSRTLTAATASEIAKTVTRPFFLIKISWLVDVISYLSTGGTVSFDGETWTGGNATLEELRSLPGGAMQGKLSLTNTDNSASALVLQHELSDAPVDISMLYGDGPWVAADAVPVFSGVIDGARIGAARVVLGLVSRARRAEFGPRIICAPPLCNHLPPNGIRIAWGGDVVELYSR